MIIVGFLIGSKAYDTSAGVVSAKNAKNEKTKVVSPTIKRA